MNWDSLLWLSPILLAICLSIPLVLTMKQGQRTL